MAKVSLQISCWIRWQKFENQTNLPKLWTVNVVGFFDSQCIIACLCSANPVRRQPPAASTARPEGYLELIDDYDDGPSTSEASGYLVPVDSSPGQTPFYLVPVPSLPSFPSENFGQDVTITDAGPTGPKSGYLIPFEGDNGQSSSTDKRSPNEYTTPEM